MFILPPHSRMMPMMRGWGMADFTPSACQQQQQRGSAAKVIEDERAPEQQLQGKKQHLSA
jgi:hypothetical protein